MVKILFNALKRSNKTFTIFSGKLCERKKSEKSISGIKILNQMAFKPKIDLLRFCAGIEVKLIAAIRRKFPN